MGPQPEPYVPERDPQAQVTIEGQYRRVDEEDGK